ncbi:MAG: imidazole glycerol phosphate synthase subunit HisH [Caulobacteraceae bacterium]
MQSVALIDYGSGNLRSAEKALQKAAASLSRPATVVATDDPDRIAKADLVVLPGVGAFAACMGALCARDGVVEAMTEAVKERGAPFPRHLCRHAAAGRAGLEFGETPGLGWIEGDVRRIKPEDPHCKVPHMGWNSLEGALPEAMFAGLGRSPHMYFTHSFAIFPAWADDVAASTDHGGRFAAAVMRGNVAGVQFHPEKSQAAGQRLLTNILEWRP